jgi:hypothetical protein
LDCLAGLLHNLQHLQATPCLHLASSQTAKITWVPAWILRLTKLKQKIQIASPEPIAAFSDYWSNGHGCPQGHEIE